MKKFYRFTKTGTVIKNGYKEEIKLLIELSKKNNDKYRYILKIDDKVFKGWTVKKFSDENDPDIQAKNIYMMEEFFQGLIISEYREHYNLDLLENFIKSRGETVNPIQFNWNHIREDYLKIW